MTLAIAMPVAIQAVPIDDAAACERARAFVTSRPDATPFHLPEWSAAVARGCGQRSHFLVAERADGRICGVLPLTETRSALFGSALVSAGFGVGGGALAENCDVEAELLAAGWQIALDRDCPTMELRGGMTPGAPWRVDESSYLGFSRPIAASDDAELLAIPRKQRAEVRKALAGGGKVSVGAGPADLHAHYGVYAQSVRNLGTPVFPRSLFSETLTAFGGAADILTVRHDGVPVASVLSLYFNRTVYPYWGGGTAAARGLRANELMYFALMRHARERGCDRFDFGRSKPGTGPAAFKKNWGFEGVPLRYFKRSRDGWPAREINPLNPRYRLMVAAWRQLPLWIANRVGPPIARGLG